MNRVQKDFPVTLYTAPACPEYCEQARALLNRRGIPFAETQVWNAETLSELKSKSGAESVPVLVVGTSVLNGFDPARYDMLLDSAGYPKQGTVPARSQEAPGVPEGYVPPPAVESAPTAAPSGKPGPYDTSGLPSNRSDKPGPYDTSGLPSNRIDKPGPYDSSQLKGKPPKTGPYLAPDAVK